jgi:DMSO/TMAO reductase YedYZ molybdopterin-dependent catalytic subunit
MIERRTFLKAAGVAVALRPSLAEAQEQLVRYAGYPQNLSTPLAYFDRLITPTPVFFVRSHFGPPALDRSRKVVIDGLVKTPLSLSVDELRSGFPQVTVTAVLQCSGNGRSLHAPPVPGIQWDHGAVGQATFTGARLKDVLAKAGADKDAAHVRLAGADAPPKPSVPAFLRSVPIERALDPSTLIAHRMNGEDLTLAHGAPLRLVVPGWAGDHWVKWLVSVRPHKAEAEGFYMQTAYRMPAAPVEPGSAVPPEKMKPATTFPVNSLIAKPARGTTAPPGKQEIVGFAFSGDAPLATVEVSIDGGKTFAPAKLEGEPGAGRAQVFRFTFERREPGEIVAIARATDKKGNRQPERAVWNPSGYFWNGWHTAAWTVKP